MLSEVLVFQGTSISSYALLNSKGSVDTGRNEITFRMAQKPEEHKDLLTASRRFTASSLSWFFQQKIQIKSLCSIKNTIWKLKINKVFTVKFLAVRMEAMLSNVYEWLIFTCQEITEGFFPKTFFTASNLVKLFITVKRVYIIFILIWYYTAVDFHQSV